MAKCIFQIKSQIYKTFTDRDTSRAHTLRSNIYSNLMAIASLIADRSGQMILVCPSISTHSSGPMRREQTCRQAQADGAIKFENKLPSDQVIYATNTRRSSPRGYMCSNIISSFLSYWLTLQAHTQCIANVSISEMNGHVMQCDVNWNITFTVSTTLHCMQIYPTM